MVIGVTQNQGSRSHRLQPGPVRSQTAFTITEKRLRDERSQGVLAGKRSCQTGVVTCSGGSNRRNFRRTGDLLLLRMGPEVEPTGFGSIGFAGSESEPEQDVSRLQSGWSTAIDAQRWANRRIWANGSGIGDARRLPLRAVQPRMATVEAGEVQQP